MLNTKSSIEDRLAAAGEAAEQGLFSTANEIFQEVKQELYDKIEENDRVAKELGWL